MTPSVFGPLGNAADQDRYIHLADRHFDGELTAEESRELGRLLTGDAARAREFIRRAMFHGHVRALLRLEQEERKRDHSSMIAQRTEAGPGAWRRPAATSVLLGLTLTGLIFAGLAFAGLSAFMRSPSRTRDESSTAATPAVSPPVAVLAASFDAVWSDPNIAFELRQGDIFPRVLTLVSGRVEFLFASGATAVIEGPATFEPVSHNTLRVTAGSVRCRCPRPGTELRVETPSGTIVDLGTEFAVSVEPNSRTQVAVIEGEVRVDGRDSSRLMSAGEAVSIDRGGKAWQDASFLKQVAEPVRITTVDPSIFASCRNALVDSSFETENAEESSGGPNDPRMGAFHLGPWRGSLGHVEQVSAQVASGRHALRISARGSRFWPLVAQAVATGDITGRPVMAAVRACQSQDDPLTGHQCAVVKLVFVNTQGQQFASAERYFLRAGEGATGFVEAAIAAQAPAGTATVQCQVLLNACGTPTGSLIVDDAALLVGPFPSDRGGNEGG